MKNIKKFLLVWLSVIGISIGVTIGIMPMLVDAYIPVKYSCCIDYSLNNGMLINGFEKIMGDGIQLDNFENLNNWTVGGIGVSQQADAINYEEGNQSLKLTATNGNRVFSDKVLNNDFSKTKNFAFWIYVYNADTIDHVSIYFTSTQDWSKMLYAQSMQSNLKKGWNKIIFNKRNFINSGGESWNNIITRVRLIIYPTTDQNTDISLDNLRYDVTDDWTVGGIGASLVPDTINFKEGLMGLKLMATNGNYAYMDLPINKDFSNTNNFAIWTYVDNASNVNNILLYLTSNGTTFNRYFLDSEYHGVKTGWNKLVFNKNNFNNTGGESWDNINMIRLSINPIGKSNINVTFDDLRYDITGKRAKLMIEFDDGDLSTYTKAYPVLSANNQPGVSFIVTSYMGSQASMNLDNLRTLQNAGWDISSHTIDHPYLTKLNDSMLIYELNESYDWLIANKFQKSAGFIAYPYGVFNDNVIEKAKQRYVLGRATLPEPAQQHFTPEDDSIQFIQREIPVYNTTSVQSVEDSINVTINAKLLGILVFHDIVDSFAYDRYQYLTTDLQKISNYIKSRSTDLDVVTYSDYVKPNINNFTPVINKTTRIYSNGSSILIDKNKYDEYMPNMTIVSSAGFVDININKYNESGGLIEFNESSQEEIQISYDIGDRIPLQVYKARIYWSNGTIYKDFNVIADNSGHIKYNSTLFGDRKQEIILEKGGISIFNIVNQKYIYQEQNNNPTNIDKNLAINFSLDGYIGAKMYVTVTSPTGIEKKYNITMQNTHENESIIYNEIKEFGIYTITYTNQNSIIKSTKFEYKQKPIIAFVVASDLHYGIKDDKLSSGFTINRFISDINNQIFFPYPDFISLVGDTADNALYINDSKSLYDTFKVPYYITIGNAESNSNAKSREPVGHRGQTFYNLYGIKYNYTVTKGDYTFIFGGVESDYPPFTNYAGSSFGDANYSLWIENILAKNAYKPIISFSHYPSQKMRDAGGARGVGLPGIRSKFEKYNNMIIEFSGDDHLVGKNVINNITYVVDGAIINQPYKFDYVEIYPDKIHVHAMPYRLDTDDSLQYIGTYWQGNTDSLHDEVNYTMGNPDENEFEIKLVNITSTKLTNLWNFTASIEINNTTLGNNIILDDNNINNNNKNNVLVDLSPYEMRNIVNMDISTSKNITMNVTSFDSIVKFNESLADSDGNASTVYYNIGDRIPNERYSVKFYMINGTKYKDLDVLSNNNGYINYSSTISKTDYQVISPINQIYYGKFILQGDYMKWVKYLPILIIIFIIGNFKKIKEKIYANKNRNKRENIAKRI